MPNKTKKPITLASIEYAVSLTDIPKGDLRDVLSEWIDEENITAFKIDEEKFRLYVIVSNGPNLYSLNRLFPLGKKWQISVDYTNLEIKDLLDKLLEKLCTK